MPVLHNGSPKLFFFFSFFCSGHILFPGGMDISTWCSEVELEVDTTSRSHTVHVGNMSIPYLVSVWSTPSPAQRTGRHCAIAMAGAVLGRWREYSVVYLGWRGGFSRAVMDRGGPLAYSAACHRAGVCKCVGGGGQDAHHPCIFCVQDSFAYLSDAPKYF